MSAQPRISLTGDDPRGDAGEGHPTITLTNSGIIGEQPVMLIRWDGKSSRRNSTMEELQGPTMEELLFDK